MEEHRLKSMPEEYDQELFNDIFKKTEALRQRLAWQIDLNKFKGIERSDILAWFDIKFVFAFQKYHLEKTDPEILKAHIIKSLQFYKNRILRKAYSKENEAMANSQNIDDLYDLKLEDNYEYNDEDISIVKEFIKSHLTSIAYDVFLIQIYPPEYILCRIKPTQLHRIPANLIAEYLGISEDEVIKYRKNIKKIIELAKIQFKNYISNFGI